MRRSNLALAFWAATVATFAVGAADETGVQRAADLASPVPITAGGKPIDVEGFAAPFVGDFDEDGKNDLLVGQCQAGRLRIYRNVGTNARPKFDQFEWFTTTGGVTGVPICCRVAFTPQLIDFDGDGRTDVLKGGALGRLYLFRRNQDGTFAEAEVLENKYGGLQMGRHFPSGNRIPYNATCLPTIGTVMVTPICWPDAEGISSGIATRARRAHPSFGSPKSLSPPANGRSEASAETTCQPASTPSASPISMPTAGSTCCWVTTFSIALI